MNMHFVTNYRINGIYFPKQVLTEQSWWQRRSLFSMS